MGTPRMRLISRTTTEAAQQAEGAEATKPLDPSMMDTVSGYRVRSSAEISADSLAADYLGRSDETSSSSNPQFQNLPLSYFLQNWRWYIRGHWKQAVVAAGVYGLTFFIWTRLA